MADTFYVWNRETSQYNEVSMLVSPSMDTYTYQEINRNSNLAEENVTVSVCADAGGTDVVAQGITDEDGNVEFYLPIGQTYYLFRRKNGYRVNNPVVINT